MSNKIDIKRIIYYFSLEWFKGLFWILVIILLGIFPFAFLFAITNFFFLIIENTRDAIFLFATFFIGDWLFWLISASAWDKAEKKALREVHKKRIEERNEKEGVK